MGEKRRIPVGPVSDFPAGVLRILEAAGRSIGVVNTAGAFHAVRNVCPHQLAPICRGTLTGTMLPSARGEWIYGMADYVLRCPRHGWEFDIRTGESVCNADRRRLATFPVSVEDGVVYVTMRSRGGGGDAP